MNTESSKVRFWRAKLANAKAAHAAELARMSDPRMGASLSALDRYSGAISKAERGLERALSNAYLETHRDWVPND